MNRLTHENGLDSEVDLLELLAPGKLWSRAEILANPCSIPKKPGIYAWHFLEVPPNVPIGDCHRLNEFTLLYVGIAPRKTNQPTKQNLAKRIRYHLSGNAYGSTLRLSLGCLLSQRLNIKLHKTGSSNRLTFGKGENALSDWMAENAFVIWLVRDEPWTVEEQLIKMLNLPLNLRGNEGHPFHPILTEIRFQCKQEALLN